MKYELVLFERGETPTDLTATVICAHHSREVIEKFINAGKNSGVAKEQGFVLNISERRKGRAVRVVSVSPDTMLCGFEYGELFSSAQAASDALKAGGMNVTYNVVLKKLDALKYLDPRERIAYINGVGFQYDDDWMANVHI